MILTTAYSRKFVAWGLTVCLLGLLWGGLIRPLASWVLASLEMRDDMRFALVRAQAARAPAGQDDASIMAARQQLADLLLIGAHETDAAAQLQSTVATLLQADGIQLEKLQAVPAVQANSLTRLSLDVHAHGPESAVVQLLAAIESAPPYFSIERAVLRAQGDQVALEMTISGFWLPAAGKGGTQP